MYELKRSAIISVIGAALFLMGASNDRNAKPAKSPATLSGEKCLTNTFDKPVQFASVPNNVKIQDKPLYRPPLRGAPSGRIGGGTRGASERESFSLQVLAPDHVGFTVSDQPSLFWYISKATTYPVELTVIERSAVKPLVDKIIRSPHKGGIQAVNLAECGVHLRRNVQYKWFVTLVIDHGQRSKDILAGGIVTLVDPSPTLLAKLKKSNSNRTPHIYAEEGLWYDAFAAISKKIDALPDSVDLHNQRAALLEQVGLTEVADFENRHQPSLH